MRCRQNNIVDQTSQSKIKKINLLPPSQFINETTSPLIIFRLVSQCYLMNQKTPIWTLLGATIDSALLFDIYATSQCFKIIQKLDVFYRITNYMTFDKKTNIFGTFFTSKSNYFSLNRMLNGRGLSTKINHLKSPKKAKLSKKDTTTIITNIRHFLH